MTIIFVNFESEKVYYLTKSLYIYIYNEIDKNPYMKYKKSLKYTFMIYMKRNYCHTSSILAIVRL